MQDIPGKLAPGELANQRNAVYPTEVVMIKATEPYVQPMDQPWLLGRVPNGYWDERRHRVAYMRWLGDRLAYSSPEDWYAIKRRHFQDNRGGGLLKTVYGDSPLKALCDFMPDQDWQPWRLHSTPQRYWADRANRQTYMKWLEQQLAIERPDQWYAVTKEDFVRNSGHGLLIKHYGDSVFAAVKEYLPRRCWLPWRFSTVPQGFWQKADNRFRYLDWLTTRLRIRVPEQWYSVTYRQIADNHGLTLVAYYDYSVLKIVSDYLPNHEWKPWLFRRIPANFWQDPANRQRYLVWLGNQLGFQSPSDWCRLSRQDVIRTGGGLLLTSVCDNRLRNLLQERYPTVNGCTVRNAMRMSHEDRSTRPVASTPRKRIAR